MGHHQTPLNKFLDSGNAVMLVPIVTRNIIFLNEFSVKLKPIKRTSVLAKTIMNFRK